jgi:O-antigen/teichoic acid export membrane protein
MEGNALGKISGRDIRAGATTLLVGQVVQVAVAFSANLILVRYILPEGFGRFAIVLATASLLLSVLSIRINALIIRVPQSDFTEQLQERYFSYLTIETTVAMVLGLLWVALSRNAVMWDFVLVILVCVQHWTQQNKCFFERSMPYVRLSLIETGCSVFAHFAGVLAALAGAGVVALYFREMVLTVTTFIALALMGGITWRRLRWLSRAEWTGIMREGRGIWLDAAMESGYQRITVVLAGLIGGDRGAGLFFQAQRLAVLPNQILSPLVGRLVVNLFGREERPSHRKRLRDRLLISLAPALALAATGAVLFADPVVPWLFGANWAMTADLLMALGGVIMFASLFEVLKSYCVVTRSMRTLFLGRVMQYLAFGALPVLVGIGLVDNAMTSLALCLSIGLAMAFLVVGGVLLRTGR